MTMLWKGPFRFLAQRRVQWRGRADSLKRRKGKKKRSPNGLGGTANAFGNKEIRQGGAQRLAGASINFGDYYES